MSIGGRLDSDLGFKYTQKLCEAIELFTYSAEANDPCAFLYRRANLRYAVERAMYFSFVNNDRLYALFARWARGELRGVDEVATQLEKELALHLFEGTIHAERFRVSSPDRLHPRRIARYVARLTGRWLRPLFPRINPGSLSAGRRATVLIHVMDVKFVRYLRPITDRLPAAFAYLLVLDSNLKSFLLENGLPFVDCTNMPVFVGPRRLGSYGNGLHGFGYLTRWYDHFHTALSSLKPECVLLVEGNSPDDEVINQVCRQLFIPVVCLEQGWSPIIHNGFRNMSYTKMLVWGEGFQELLEPYNPKQKFVVVGNHAVEPEDATRCQATRQDRRAVCFFLQPLPTRLIDKRCWDELLKLAKWAAGEHAEVPVLIREHPAYPLSESERAQLEGIPNIRLVPPDEYPLSEVLNLCRLTVSIYSSTILESIAAGVLPMIFNPTSLPSYFPDVHVAGAGIEVKTFEEAVQLIRRILSDPVFASQRDTSREEFRRKYFYQGERHPADRIVEEILSLCPTSSR